MKITINKKGYALDLKYGFKAFRVLSEKLDIEVDDILVSLQTGKLAMKYIVPLLWVGMVMSGQKSLEYETLLDDFDNATNQEMPPWNDIKMLILDELTEAFTKDSKNVSSPKAVIPSKKNKKNGAGGATLEKRQK